MVHEFDLVHLFEGIAEFQFSKLLQIQNLAEKFQFSLKDVVFFDDMADNVHLCRMNDIQSITVNPRTGITLEDVAGVL